jgi:hypothetical protein
MNDIPQPTKINEALGSIEKSLKIWGRQAIYLRVIHALLTFSAVVCSLLVAAKIRSFGPDYVEWLSFGAAVSIGLISAFDLGSKANRIRRAWRKLRTAYLRYKAGKLAADDLIKIYEESEDIIGDVREEPKQ